MGESYLDKFVIPTYIVNGGPSLQWSLWLRNENNNLITK